ncbi:unnamed protein product [[Candida] boidinii]|uniref:Unnamed protein product n=1 Tax=Candida boidinii TaxID=5477 RepID=A0ACB5TRN3_CANBO|nr:unnamed protein product [[Candida] boidinii]
MVLQSSAGARFRQRKISVKQTLQVWKQKDLPDLDTEDQQRELQQIETGVEKGEEEEEHLQKVINAAQAKFSGNPNKKVEQVYIPTPDASKVWPESSKYYTSKFIEPASYIKFSATVEDTVGCPYCLDEIDEEFLIKFNKELPNKVPKCTESEFELLAYRFETVINEKQPFITVDPSQILKYEEIRDIALVPDKNDPLDLERTLAKQLGISNFKTLLDAKPSDGREPKPLKDLFQLYGAKIYDHWKKRRLERNGKPRI